MFSIRTKPVARLEAWRERTGTVRRRVIFFGTPSRGSELASMSLTAARITGLGIGASKQHLFQSLEVGSQK